LRVGDFLVFLARSDAENKQLRTGKIASSQKVTDSDGERALPEGSCVPKTVLLHAHPDRSLHRCQLCRDDLPSRRPLLTNQRHANRLCLGPAGCIDNPISTPVSPKTRAVVSPGVALANPPGPEPYGMMSSLLSTPLLKLLPMNSSEVPVVIPRFLPPVSPLPSCHYIFPLVIPSRAS